MKRLVPIAIALSLTILLASIAMAQGLANVRLSDAPDGPAMTQFPSGTAVVYAIFDYADMVGEPIKVRVYDNYGSILFEQTQNYTGSGTESVATAPSEGVFPDGRYVTNFYRGEYVSRTILWDVGEPVARPTAEPTPSPVAKIYNHKGNELCTQLNTHLRQALEAGYEMQEFGERLLTALDPEKAEEEAPQVLIELSQVETKLDLAQGDIDSALAIINEAKGLSLPDWYRDYFAKKEEVANHLNAAFEEAVRLLPRVVLLLETMPGVYRSVEEAGTASQEIGRAIASMSVVGFKEWAQLRQKVSEYEQIVSALRTEMDQAYAKLPVPLFKSFSDSLVPALEVSGVLHQAIDAGEAGDADRAQSLARQAMDMVQEAQPPEMEETETWFMEEYGSPMEEFQRHLEQAATANDQVEMAFGKVEPMPTPVAAPTGIEVTGSEWLDAIPLPTGISTEPEVVGTNLGLALFFALAFGLASALFNATLEENEEFIRARLAPLLAPLRRAAERLPRPAEGPRIRIAKPILLLLFSALLYAFLDPEFGISASGAIVLLSLFVALAVLVYSYEGTQALLGARFYKLRARFQLFPIALAFGVACVLLTRWMDFHPGYLYGFVAGFTFLGMETETPRRWALLVLAGAGALLAASLAAWGLAVPVSRLAEGGLPGASVLYGVLVAIFVAGLEGLLFTLVPLTFMDGSKVMAWSRAVWGVAFGLAAWLFFHVLINPGSAYLEALTSKKVLLMLGTLATYGFLTVGTWLFFRWYAGRRGPPPAPVEVEEPVPPPEGEAIEPAEPPPAAPPEEPTMPSEVPPVREKREMERVRIRRPTSLSVMAISNFVMAALYIVLGIVVMLVPYEDKPTTVVELIGILLVFLGIAALPALVGWATWTQKGWVYYILLIQGIFLLPFLLFIPGALWLSALGKPGTKIALGRIGDKEKAALKPLAQEAIDAGQLNEALGLFRLYLQVNPLALDREEIESLVSKIEARLRPAPEAPTAPEIPAAEAPVPPIVPTEAALEAPPRPEPVAPVRPEAPEERVYRWRPKSWLRRLVLALGALVCFFIFSYFVQMQARAVVPPTVTDWLTMLVLFEIWAWMMFEALRPTSMREVVISPEKGVIFRRKSGKEKPVIADVTQVKGGARAVMIEGRSPRGKKVRMGVARRNLEPGKFQEFVEDVRRLAPPAEAVKAKGRLRRVCAWVTNFLAGACLLFFVGIAWGTGRDYTKGIPTYALGEEIRVAVIFLLAALAMALLSVLLAERKKRAVAIWSVVIGLAIVAGAVMAWPALQVEWPKVALLQVELPFAKAPPAETPAPTSITFRGDIFSFEYPSDWKRMSESEANAARAMLSLGGAAEDFEYVGGVYTGDLFTGQGRGLIAVTVIKDPRLPGTLTDAQFSQLKATYERQMDSGLLSIEKAQVGSMSGVELELLQSGTRIWLLLIFSGEQGRAYEFFCLAPEENFDDHLAAFEMARSTLRIGAPTPIAPTPPTPVAPTLPTPTATAPATPSPTVPAPTPPSEVITYTVQAGDTLSQIAAEFGVTVDAITEANDIEDPSLIRVGQVLVIPSPGPRG